MSSIDERVVQMQFENSQFEKGIKETVKSLGLLKKELDMKDASESIEHLQSVGDSFSLAQISSQLEKLVDRTSWFTKMIHREIDSIWAKTKSLGKSLSVDQVSAGWTKYEQKTASVQTIMNATGKSIDEVNGYLDKLMWFSDETSYNFTEMTAALGTLTSSGGDIEKVIPMIEGMATATAFAGKSASEFSRVIYNLNQSYSQGYLSWLDWRSIQLANVDSEQLKQTLIDTAVELGTLKKLSDGTFKTKKGTVVNTANMANSLNERWATKEVMEGAFGKFASVMDEAYKLVEAGEYDTASEALEALNGNFNDTYYKAAKASQSAKSFREAIDATKDAVSSGWMETFELIFGNYEEATVLWTDLANRLWNIFASGGGHRNEVLKEWKEMGGRKKLIDALSRSFDALESIIKKVSEAFREFFPHLTADDLMSLTDAIDALSWKLYYLAGANEAVAVSWDKVANLKEPDVEWPGELKRGDKGDPVKEMQERLEAAGYSVGKAGIDGIFGPDTEAALKEYEKSVGMAVDGIYDQITHEKLAGNSQLIDYPGELKRGDKGDAVKEMQRWLIAAGYSVGKTGVDGIFGPATEAALKEYEKSIGEISDGVYDKKVHNKLVGNDAKQLKQTEAGVTGTVSALGLVTKFLQQRYSGFIDKTMQFVRLFMAIGRFGTKLFLTAFQALLKILNAISPVVDAVYTVLSYLAGKLADFIGKTYKKFFGSLLDTLDRLLEPVRKWAKQAKKDILNFFGFTENGKPIKYPEGEMSKFAEIFEKVKARIQPVLDWFKQAYNDVLDFFGLGKKEKTTFFDSLTNLFGRGKEAEETAEEISKFSKLLGKAKAQIQPVLDWFSNAWTDIKNFFTLADIDDGQGNKITRFTAAWESFKVTIQPVLDWFSNAWTDIKNFFTLADIDDGQGNKITRFAEAWESFKARAQGVFDWISNAWIDIKNFFTLADIDDGQGNKITRFTETMLKVRGYLQPVVDWLKSAYTSIKTFFGIGQEVYENRELVPSRFSVLFEKAKDRIQSVIDWFKNAFKGNDIAESLRNFWESIKSFFGHNEGEIGFGVIGDVISKIVKFAVDNKGAILVGVGIYALIIAPIKALLEYVQGMMNTWNTFTKKVSGGDKKKAGLGETIGKTIQQIGIGVALIAASLFLIGKMQPEQLKRAVWTLIGLFGTLITFSVVANKLGGNAKSLSSAAYSIRGIGKAIATLALVVLILGRMNPDHLKQGEKALVMLGVFLIAFLTLTTLLAKITKTKTPSVDLSIQLKGLIGLAVAVGILVACLKVLGGMNEKELENSMTCLSVLLFELVAIMGVSSLCGKFLKPARLSGLLAVAGAIAILSLIVIALGNMNEEKLKRGVTAITILGVLLTAISAVFAFGGLFAAGGLIGGAASIAVAFAVLTTIIAAFFVFLGFLNRNGAIAKMIDSAAGVLKSIGRAFGSIAGGFLEAIGDGLTAIRNGVSGMSDNKHLDEDLESSFGVVEKVFDFLNKFAKSRKTLGWNSDVNNRLSLILQNIQQFGNAIGAVATAINGLSKSNYEADTDAAVRVMNSVANALIGLQELGNERKWETEVTGGISSWWAVTNTKIQQILADIEKFGSVVGIVRENVSGLASGKPDKNGKYAIERDVDVATAIVTQVMESLASLGDLAASKTWLQPRLFLHVWLWGENREIDNLLELCSKFGDAAGKIKEGVSGLASGKPDKNGKYQAERDVDVATAIVTQVTNALSSLGDLAAGSTWFKPKTTLAKWLTGYNTQIDPMLETIGKFGDVSKKVRDAVYGISDKRTSRKDANGEEYGYKAIEDADVATTVVDKIVKYLDELTQNVALKAYGKGSDFDNWIIDTGTAAEFVIGKLNDFTPAMRDILSAITELDLANAEADAQTAVNAVGTVVEFLSGIQEYDLEASKGALDKFFNGDTVTDSMISRLGPFGKNIGEMFGYFSGFSESTIESDAQTAFTILQSFIDLVSLIGSPGKRGRASSSIGLLMQVSAVLSSLGESINQMGIDLQGADLGHIQDITGDVETVFSILERFIGLISVIDSDSENVQSDIALIMQVSSVLSGLGVAINEMSYELQGTDLQTIQDISDFLNSLNGMLSGIKGVEDVAKLFSDLKSLFSDGEGDTGIPTWLESIDSDRVASKLTGFVQAFLQNARPDFDRAKAEFTNAGYNLALGFGRGITNGTESVKIQAVAFINTVIQAMKRAAGIASPSRVTTQLGRFLDLGLIDGIQGSSHLVERSMTDLSERVLGRSNGIFAELSNELSQDMDFDPVVRPIVDLSDVVNSSRRMNGLLSANRSIELAGAATVSTARFKADKDARENREMGTLNQGGTSVEDSTAVTLTGNNFYVRSERDVKSLASEIATLTKQQQRSLGAAY